MILAEGLVTENRKNNAISKIGRVKTNDQKELLEKMLIEDVLETLQEKGGEKEKEKGKEKDNGGRKQTLWEKLSAREKQEAKEHVQSLVRTFLTKKKWGMIIFPFPLPFCVLSLIVLIGGLINLFLYFYCIYLKITPLYLPDLIPKLKRDTQDVELSISSSFCCYLS